MNKFALAGALAASAAVGLAATSADAFVTTYSDVSSFDAAATSLATVDFEDLAFENGVSFNTDQTYSAKGAVFSPDSGGDLYVASPYQSSNPTTALGVDTPTGGGLNISFASSQTEFGADLFQNFGGGTQNETPVALNVSLYNGSLLVGSYTPTIAPFTGTFFGLTGSNAFTSVILSTPGGFAVADNVSFGPGAGAVPRVRHMANDDPRLRRDRRRDAQRSP